MTELDQAQEAFFAAEEAYCAYCSDATAQEYVRTWQELANVSVRHGWTLAEDAYGEPELTHPGELPITAGYWKGF